jgi:threonine aldolase
MIDLRSDTVTLPSPGMRRAMADAEVGDDQYGEDPSVNRLQDEIAELLGTEASLFFPSGTMANQAALRTLTRPGDDVLVPLESHMFLHESGGGGANAGVQFSSIGSAGVFTPTDIESAYKPPNHVVYPPTTLMVVENTHNRASGVVWPIEALGLALASARRLGLAAYLDGARLLNAAAALGVAPPTLSAGFDLIGLSLSKGLGAPAGSMLAGSKDLLARAHRYRRMLGGAMRQAGILAAAGSYALVHNVARLSEDHANAAALAARLAACPQITVDLARVQTNIVIFEVGDPAAVVARCREAGVLLNAFGGRRVRAVTHLDVDAVQCEQAAQIIVSVAAGR